MAGGIKEAFLVPDKTPPKETASETEEVQQAHPHHKDKGHVVKTAFGEQMSGAIADIADGDDEK
jgi:hypothetical protein